MFSVYQKLRDPSGSMTDNCLVNVIPIGDKLIAATEVDYVHEISSKTLDSVGRVSFAVLHACMQHDTCTATVEPFYCRHPWDSIVHISM